jgi:ABC-2 type transport system permease protein
MTALRNIAAIIQKEWRHYFGGPTAYVVVFVCTLLFGLFFCLFIQMFIQQGMRMMGGGVPIGEGLIQPLIENMTITAMFLMPMLTMRLFAEEKRLGTMELLATTPITDLEIVVGKFLAALGVWALMIAASLVNLLLLWKYSTPVPEWKPVATAALAMLLYGGCYIAIGTFLSTLTRNQIVAAVLSFCLFLMLLLTNWALNDPTAGPLMRAFGYLSLTSHLRDLMKGVLDLKDIVFYLSFITFSLFLAHQSVASERWRS